MSADGVPAGPAALALADEAFQRHDVDAVVAHLSAAVRAFTADDDARMAAMTCARLGEVLATAMGNQNAARAWFTRARRLIADQPPCVEQGWIALAEMGCDVDDPARLLADAELGLDRARRFGDVNLETKALADAGLAHVQLGHVSEGMQLLDEAMALASGPAEQGVAAKSVCSFFTACYVSFDYERVATWSDLLTRRGVLGWNPTPPSVFLSSHCESVRAALLIETGCWTEAERVLLAAKQRFEQFFQAPSWHPDVALAELRVRQGRFADAEALLLGKEQVVSALLPAAQLHLARGDHGLALAAARRGVKAVGADVLRAIELLIVVVDACLASDDLEGAEAACRDLARRTAAIDIPTARAHSAAAQARTLAAGGDLAGAVALVADAVDDLDPARSAWLRTSLLFELADLRRRAGDVAGAEIDARAAAAALQGLDVVAPAHWAAPDPTPTPAATATLADRGKWWDVGAGGVHVRLADTKGLRYLADLIAHPGLERHALDLVDRVEGVDPDRKVDRRRLANTGPTLDGAARANYRRRIEVLRGEANDAIETGQLETAEALQDELDQLVAQLAAAFGLGGRTRSAGSAVEKARLNVTRAIRSAIGKVSAALPEAGAALDRSVRTGIYCSYHPADGDLRWVVESVQS